MLNHVGDRGGTGTGHPYAEVAEDSQRAQKVSGKQMKEEVGKMKNSFDSRSKFKN
jgi:hypothetical protein